MKKVIIILPVLLLILLSGCNQKPKKEKPVTQVKPKIVIPDFNADSAFLYVKKQVEFGPRVPNTSTHAECASYLATKLGSYTPNVMVQQGKVRAFNGTTLNIKNIIASFQPEKNARILLAAHWDSRPFADHDPDPANLNKPIDGANDGASGVGILIEIARILKNNPSNIGVDIILFDAEDYGPPEDGQLTSENEDWGLGSQYWSKNPHIPGYRARYGVLLDMVGAANARFPKEGFSRMYAPDILNKVWNKARLLGYDDFFLEEHGGYINDDHLYVNTIRNIPMIDIIHLDHNSVNGTFFNEWHTLNDNIEIIEPYTLKVVGQTLLKVIYEE